MQEKILEVINEYENETRKCCYKINYIDSSTTILDEKIGGLPYLPIGEEYPKDKNNNPMALLIQINLNKLELNDYPKGILEVFITTDINEIYGNMELPSDCYTFRLFQEGLEYQTNLPLIDLNNFIFNRPIKLDLSKQVVFKPYNPSDNKAMNLLLNLLEDKFNVILDYPMQMEEKLNIKYYDLMNKLDEDYKVTSNIGGYPFFINEVDYDYDDKTECIMSIESAISLGLCIGPNAGDFYVLIPKEDLKNGDFSNALLKFQF